MNRKKRGGSGVKRNKFRKIGASNNKIYVKRRRSHKAPIEDAKLESR